MIKVDQNFVESDETGFIPYSRQNVNEVDINRVCEVLQSDFLTQGPAVPAFEKAVANKVGALYTVAVNSGTSALHLSCLSLEVGPGDVVWTTPNTFVASANCALYCGANVDFVDIDPETWCLSVKKLEAKLLKHKSQNLPLPKVVIPVHLSGQSCDMQAIAELGQKFGFRIIEDASHAVGGRYLADAVGNCRYSDITVFSFHAVKIITSGEGGMALTNDKELARRIGMLRTHGITREVDQLEYESAGPWYYEQQDLGFNYRMTDLQAALGLSQLEKLEEFVLRRNKLADRYLEALQGLPLAFQKVPEGVISSRHLYVIRVDASRHRLIFEGFLKVGIGVNLHYMPVHKQPYYQNLGFSGGQFPESETYGQEAISLPLFPAMTEAQQDHVLDTLRKLI